MVGLIDMLTGILFLVLNIPLLKHKVPMNHFYGFRFRQSFTSEANWYAINEYGARRMIVWSLVIIFLGFMGALPPMASKPLQLFFSSVPLLVIVPGVQAYLYARKLQ